jgi:predicted GIY-YIG superfamily endonuclease
MKDVVYLIHFEKKYFHAQHYIGYTHGFKRRMEHHKAGTGSRLLAHLKKIGIAWEVVRKWPGDGNFERKLKNQRNAPRFCPVCIKEKKKQ